MILSKNLFFSGDITTCKYWIFELVPTSALVKNNAHRKKKNNKNGKAKTMKRLSDEEFPIPGGGSKRTYWSLLNQLS